MARYKLVKDEDLNVIGVCVNDSTHPTLAEGASIPNDTSNRHWQEYLTWEESNDADAADTIDYMAKMRQERDQRLSACDWTHIDDSPLSSEDKTSWATYRQSLRDMPQNNPSVTTKAQYEALAWPTEPA